MVKMLQLPCGLDLLVKQISQASNKDNPAQTQTHAHTHTLSHHIVECVCTQMFVIHKFFSIKQFMHKSIPLLCGRLLCCVSIFGVNSINLQLQLRQAHRQLPSGHTWRISDYHTESGLKGTSKAGS